MAIKDRLLPEFDHETGVTRKVLARLPDGKFDWAPHPKSMGFGRLATHVAGIPGMIAPALTQDGVDFGSHHEPAALGTRAEVLETFDRAVAAARPLIEAATDDQLAAPWTLRSDGHEVFTMPKYVVLRQLVLNHLIHHRAQLALYLRLNDIPVPSIYGPSADEAS